MTLLLLVSIICFQIISLVITITFTKSFRGKVFAPERIRWPQGLVAALESLESLPLPLILWSLAEMVSLLRRSDEEKQEQQFAMDLDDNPGTKSTNPKKAASHGDSHHTKARKANRG